MTPLRWGSSTQIKQHFKTQTFNKAVFLRVKDKHEIQNSALSLVYWEGDELRQRRGTKANAAYS